MTERSEYEFFTAGFSLTTVIFVGLNLYSCSSARWAYELSQAGPIRFDHGGYSCGVPLKMYSVIMGNPNVIGFDGVPTAINLICVLISAGLVGIAFERIAGKVSN